ncbi:hypothetical protein [Rufibacter tibetensis]|uniref:Uncharacterized protein n=1 Tax=Rufibacter tibetensis TaxID=512763 RepID=A0A0P0CA30_9BACT|nr:hypothetical protein [Rufibacter tibetensis]ALJ00486.1 hypothetical protein DC20_17830 [Rufibacter tibetensis]
MPVPFLQRSHVFAAQLLHKAGLTVSQIPQAVQVTRETVEHWLQKELESGNAQQVLLVLKGHVQEKGPKLLLGKLQDMLLVRLVLHLGIRGALATNIATLILPFVLKRVYDLARQNPKMQAWWREQEWSRRIPTIEKIRSRIKEAGTRLTPSRFKPSDDPNIFI